MKKTIYITIITIVFNSCAAYVNYADHFPFEVYNKNEKAPFTVANYTTRDFALIGILIPIIPTSLERPAMENLSIKIDGGMCPVLILKNKRVTSTWRETNDHYGSKDWIRYNCEYGELPDPIQLYYLFEFKEKLYKFRFEKVYSSGYTPMVDV